MSTQRNDLRRQGLYAVPGARAASLETDLLGALDSEEIEVLFQPQYRVADRSLYGAEALARWRHPALGTIGAQELFAVAERAQCVVELSQHIFRRALGFAVDWPSEMTISLNAIPSELTDSRFGERLAALAAWSRRAPETVTVEITEDVLLEDIQLASTASATLKQLGFRIALDDFGAGFCNFRYLKRLQLDALKLDRSMVEGICRDARDVAILRGIVAMAKALSLDVVAEGIESAEQLGVIAAERCDIYQGFLDSPPLTPETFLRIARGQAGTFSRFPAREATLPSPLVSW